MKTPVKSGPDFRRLADANLPQLGWWLLLGQLVELERLGFFGYVKLLQEQNER